MRSSGLKGNSIKRLEAVYENYSSVRKESAQTIRTNLTVNNYVQTKCLPLMIVVSYLTIYTIYKDTLKCGVQNNDRLKRKEENHEDILSEGRKPLRIRTDHGLEFRAKEVQKVLKQYNIRHLFAWSERKATVSEREF